MSVVPILKKGDELLTKKCHPVEKFDRRLALLIRDMIDTLEDAQGVGLAAPQIGILRRVFVMRHEDGFVAYVNPEIVLREGEQFPIEGCLSLPGIWGKVRRPAKVRVRAQDKEGKWFEREAEGLIAEAFEHEYEHLEGQLFDDQIIEYYTPEELEDKGK
jgi:peptide deformylase